MKTISQEEKSQKQVQSKSNKARPNRLAVKLCICILVPMLLLLAGPTAAVAHQFDWTWGSYGIGENGLSYPSGVAVDSQRSYVYVVDRNNSRIRKLNLDGTLISTWNNTYGQGNGQLRYPSGIAVDGSGYVYVAETHNHRIQKFTSDGAYVATWGGPNAGTDPGQFSEPFGIAVDQAGTNVYVADMNNHRIQKLEIVDNAIVNIVTWGVYGTGIGREVNGYVQPEFRYPQGVAVDQTGGNVYVADKVNNRIQKLEINADGITVDQITQWGELGMHAGQFHSPRGIAVDGEGNVYVADTWNGRIQKLDLQGGFLEAWGDMTSSLSAYARGSLNLGGGQFNGPVAVAVDSNDNVYAADMLNHRIQKFVSGSGDSIQLTQNQNVGPGAKFSPDGARIVYTAVNPNTNQPDIWIVNADSTEQRQLTNTPAFEMEPSFTPDGTRIVYTAINQETNQLDIWIMNTDGTGEPTNLTNTAGWNEAEPRISPNGTRIVYNTAILNTGNSEIRIMNTEDGTLQAAWAATSPDDLSFNFDGTQIAYSAQGVSRDILVVNLNADGTADAPRNLTNPNNTHVPNQDEMNPVFRVDGRIVYTATRNNQSDIYAIRVSDGSVEGNYTRTPNVNEFNPRISPDGAMILYTRVDYTLAGLPQLDIWITTARRDAEQIQLTNTPEPEIEPSFSPNSTGILYTVSSTGELYLYRLP